MERSPALGKEGPDREDSPERRDGLRREGHRGPDLIRPQPHNSNQTGNFQAGETEGGHLLSVFPIVYNRLASVASPKITKAFPAFPAFPPRTKNFSGDATILAVVQHRGAQAPS